MQSLYSAVLSLPSPTPESAPVGIMDEEGPVPDLTHFSDTFDGGGNKKMVEGKREEPVDGEGEGPGEEMTDGEVGSGSDDSFHSTLDVFDASPSENQFYHSARELVTQGGVRCRKIR